MVGAGAAVPSLLPVLLIMLAVAGGLRRHGFGATFRALPWVLSTLAGIAVLQGLRVALVWAGGR